MLRLGFSGAAGLALAMAVAAGAAHADPEVMLKCDGAAPQAMRWARDTDWKPIPNPDTGVTITRDHGKYTIQVTGELAYTTMTVFPLPVQNPKAFKVVRAEGGEMFHLEKGPDGQPILKHTIRGGRDGTHQYNIREMIQTHCPVVSPDVVVGEAQAPGQGGN